MAELELTATQRKRLRSLAHHLEPAVLVGKQGVTETLVGAVDEALDIHELIKVRFNEHKERKHELAPEIAERTDSALAGVIGHVAILYRPHKDPEKREITLDD